MVSLDAPAFRPVASTLLTPLTLFAAEIAFSTASSFASEPVNVTTPSTVLTSTFMLLTSDVVASSDFTLVVIHVSVTG